MANDVFIICTKPGELSLVQKEDSKSNLIEKCKLVNRQDVLERIDISDERNLPIHLHNSCRVAIYNKARGILSRNEENEIPPKQRRQAGNQKKSNHINGILIVTYVHFLVRQIQRLVIERNKFGLGVR